MSDNSVLYVFSVYFCQLFCQCFENHILFQRNIENILLIPEGRRARQVMDPDLRPGPPRNCREVIYTSY